MGQFAKDWDQLKAIIHQKDDAIDRQAAQIAALQKQLNQPPALDADDQKAVAELRQTVGENMAPVASAPALTQKTAAPAVTTFTK